MSIADRVKDTFTTTGTGPITLVGSPPLGFQALAAVGGVGSTFPYSISGGAEWESGVGTITGTNAFSRAPTASSNGGALVNFSAGTKDFAVTMTTDSLKRGLTDPDDVGFDIIICAGQSKMCGRGTYDSLVDLSAHRIYQFGGLSGNARYQTIFAGAEPLHWPEGLNNNTGTTLTSPANSFARAYLNTLPNHRMILLVPCAWGGTSIITGSPRWAVGGDLRENMVSQANLAVTAAQALYPNSRVTRLLLDLGETDAGGGANVLAYLSAMKGLITDFRARVTGAANVPCILGGMIPEYIAQYPTGGNNIDAAQKQIAQELVKCAFVAAPGGYTSDNTHLTAPGSRISGTRWALASKAVEFAAGVDTVAPTFVSAQIANATPNTIVITMSEILAAASVPTSAFAAFAGKTVTAVNLNGIFASVVCSSAFASTDGNGTIQYTKPGSGAMLQDGSGNATLSFGPVTVTNNVAPPAVESITVTTPTAQVAGTAFTLAGTYVNVTPAALDYSTDGGTTWIAASTPTISGGNYSFSMTISATNASQTVKVRDHTNTTVIGTSGTFAVNTTPTQTITVSTPATQTVGTAYSVTGTYANGTPAALDYRLSDDTAGVWTAAPTPTIGSGSFSFSITPTTANASRTVSVRDHTTLVSGTSGAYVVNAAGAAMSLNNMGFMGTTATANVYQGTSAGFWGSDSYSTLNLAFQAGVDGEFVVQMLDIPNHAANGKEIGIGVDALTSATARYYDSIDYFLMHRSDACQAYANGVSATADAGGGAVAALQYDLVRFRRTLSSGAAGNTATMAAAVSHDGTNYTTVKTWTGVSNGVLYPHVNVIYTTSVKLISSSGLA